MKKVLLISPPYERFMGLSRFYYHIGLAMLAAVIENDGHDVLIYDADHSPNGKILSAQERMNNFDSYRHAQANYDHPIWEEITQVITEYSPDIIGISVLSMTYPVTKRLASLIRVRFPMVPIFAGGAHATLCPHDLIPFFDFVVMFEGESVICDVINGNIPKGIVQGKRITNLDELPFPAIHRLYRVESYAKRDLSIIMSSRGCPSSCKFCSSYELWKCKMVQKSPEYFISEIKYLITHYGIQDFFITDDSFTCNRKWLKEFLIGIKRFNITWRCFSRIDSLDEEITALMFEAGCRNIKLGIESGSQRILNIIDKGITLDQIDYVDKMLAKQKTNWSAYFIIGFPGETVGDIRLTQKLIQKISAKSITVNVYTPLPKNRLSDSCKTSIDYSMYSFHSPNNNFTGCIDNETFSALVNETLQIAERTYNEHLCTQ